MWKECHFAKACGQNNYNKRTVRRLIEEELQQQDESTSESDGSIQYQRKKSNRKEEQTLQWNSKNERGK